MSAIQIELVDPFALDDLTLEEDSAAPALIPSRPDAASMYMWPDVGFGLPAVIASSPFNNGAVNVLDYAEAQGSDDAAGIAAAFARAKLDGINVYIPRCDLRSSSRILIDQQGMKIVAEPGARILFSDHINPGFDIRASDVEVHNLKNELDYERVTFSGSLTADGLVPRDNNSGFLIGADRVRLINCKAKNFNNGTFPHGTYSGSVYGYNEDVELLNFAAESCDMGILFQGQKRLQIRNFFNKSTTYVQTAPPHAIYGTYATDVPCYDVSVSGARDSENLFSAAYKFQSCYRSIISDLHAETAPAFMYLADCDDSIVSHCIGTDLYYPGVDIANSDGDGSYSQPVANTGGIAVIGGSRVQVADCSMTLRDGDAVAACYRVRNSNLGGGAADDNTFANCLAIINPTGATDTQAFLTYGNRTAFKGCSIIDKSSSNQAAFKFIEGSGHKVILPVARGTDRIAYVHTDASDNYVLLDTNFLADGFDTVYGFRDFGSAAASTCLVDYIAGAGTGFRIVREAGWTNGVYLYARAAGANPEWTSEGGDTNVGQTFKTKGTGIFRWFVNALEQLRVGAKANSVSYLLVNGGTTGQGPEIAALSSEADANIKIIPKGSGVVQFGTYAGGALSPAGYITIKDASGTTRRVLIG